MKFTKKDLSFNFGFNVKPRTKGNAKSATPKGKRANPKRVWKGITFGS